MTDKTTKQLQNILNNELGLNEINRKIDAIISAKVEKYLLESGNQSTLERLVNIKINELAKDNAENYWNNPENIRSICISEAKKQMEVFIKNNIKIGISDET